MTLILSCGLRKPALQSLGTEKKRLEEIFRYYSSIATVRLLKSLVAKETVVDSFVYNYWFPLVVCW